MKIIYIKKNRHSDTLTQAIAYAIKQCKDGDAVYCMSNSARVIAARILSRKKIGAFYRKQNYGGWLVYPRLSKDDNADA